MRALALADLESLLLHNLGHQINDLPTGYVRPQVYEGQVPTQR
jgi:hypothetical protein